MQYSMKTDDVAYAYEAVVRDSGSGLTASERRRWRIWIKLISRWSLNRHLSRENHIILANDVKKSMKARSSNVTSLDSIDVRETYDAIQELVIAPANYYGS